MTETASSKTCIIVGASSGIGAALARVLAENGYRLVLMARRLALLEKLQSELPDSLVRRIDVTDPEIARQTLRDVAAEMGTVDLIVISAGVGHINPELDWNRDIETLNTNVIGFAAVASEASECFRRQGYGHLVGISSIAAIRGSGDTAAYNASKAFVSNYLQGLRSRAKKDSLPITVTEIQPGLVDTAMAQGEGLFWVADPDVAARQIYSAIRRRKGKAVVTRRWRLIALLLRLRNLIG